MIVTIIGLGLIGGSFAKDLRNAGISKQIKGIDNDPAHVKKAIELGFITHEVSINEACEKSDLIVLAVPVNSAPALLSEILDKAHEDLVVIDMGSVKANICQAIETHPKRNQYVACHPIAGTEYSGPTAAIENLFQNKINIICEQHLSDSSAVNQVAEIFEQIGSKNIYMDAVTHDKHITYVSHLSHITSFALSLTVQALEKDEENIYNMAGSGFASTVRLAKSSAEMWVPIFEANREHMLDAIDAYITNLNEIRSYIKNSNHDKMKDSILKANQIGKIL